jgi:hypothetical protein
MSRESLRQLTALRPTRVALALSSLQALGSNRAMLGRIIAQEVARRRLRTGCSVMSRGAISTGERKTTDRDIVRMGEVRSRGAAGILRFEQLIHHPVDKE